METVFQDRVIAIGIQQGRSDGTVNSIILVEGDPAILAVPTEAQFFLVFQPEAQRHGADEVSFAYQGDGSPAACGRGLGRVEYQTFGPFHPASGGDFPASDFLNRVVEDVGAFDEVPPKKGEIPPRDTLGDALEIHPSGMSEPHLHRVGAHDFFHHRPSEHGLQLVQDHGWF